jgi:hypothetical protein
MVGEAVAGAPSVVSQQLKPLASTQPTDPPATAN